ncbi:MAG: acetate--CoA ligase family protein [archaeon]
MGRTLGVSETLALAEKHGLAVARIFSADTAEFPVFVKPDISGHKSDRGLVFLANDKGELAEAVGKISPDSNPIIQERLSGTELILGAKKDPVFGTVALAGIGGTLAEAYSDAAVGVTPLSEEDALRMIDSLKGQKILSGFRGKPAVDRAALARAIVLVGKMADAEGLAELDLNPVIADGERIVAVDGRAVVCD